MNVKVLMLFSMGLILSIQPLVAQNFSFPDKPNFTTAEDYKQYNEDVLQAVSWALQTAPNAYVSKQDEIRLFFMQWIEGTPDVTVELSGEMLPFMEQKPEMLLIFMYGWTKASLENGEQLDPKEGNYAALKAVALYYDQYAEIIGGNSELKKIAKLHQKEKLRAFVAKNYKAE